MQEGCLKLAVIIHGGERHFQIWLIRTCSCWWIVIIAPMTEKIKILFVCTGNIIRSPLAEGLFSQKVKEADQADKFHVDSAGTSSYHSGEAPDSRMRRTAAQHGLEYSGSARQIRPRDLDDFDMLIVMDNSNHRNLMALAKDAEHEDKIHFMRKWDPEAAGDLDVPDPYYGGMDGFETTYQIVARSVDGLFEELDGAHE